MYDFYDEPSLTEGMIRAYEAVQVLLERCSVEEVLGFIENELEDLSSDF